MTNGTGKSIVVPKENGVMAECGDSGAKTIIQLVEKCCDAQYVDWRSRKIKHVLEIVSMHGSRVVPPFPTNCANTRCLINLTTNCCNVVILQGLNFSDKHTLKITYMNVCAIIANNGRAITVKECRT